MILHIAFSRFSSLLTMCFRCFVLGWGGVATTTIEQMSIEKNILSGTIPYTFRKMTELSSLSLQLNDLTGRMPWQLCPKYNDNMVSLKADCEEVSCSCCTACFVDSKRAAVAVSAKDENDGDNTFYATNITTPEPEKKNDGGMSRREYLRRVLTN